ncbi:hypothetical protein [Burkholderia glumae]|uniref:hypothetical protein n=1 Tax=Burkholderia glumae TaxID=337 RepID=UPI0013749F7B|nr:hypothetical protein [Burkholderia glumae]MCR1770728.1 hypothetical protein [Burkholderia glumae]
MKHAMRSDIVGRSARQGRLGRRFQARDYTRSAPHGQYPIGHSRPAGTRDATRRLPFP